MSAVEVETIDRVGQSTARSRDDTELPGHDGDSVRKVEGGGYAVLEKEGFRWVGPSDMRMTEDEDDRQESRATTSSLPAGNHVRGDSFEVLAQWEGVVASVEDDGTLWVRLTSGPESLEEVSDFSIEEVPPVDRSLVRPGAVFYWTIGYRDRPDGQRTRESSIRFRRLPAGREEDAAEASRWASETMEMLGLDRPADEAEDR